MNILCLDIRVVKNRQIICTSCGNTLKLESGHIFSHSILGLLQCEVILTYFVVKLYIVKKDNRFYLYICVFII